MIDSRLVKKLRVTPFDVATATAAAEEIGVQVSTLMLAIHNGRLPAKRIGKGKGTFLVSMKQVYEVFAHLLDGSTE